MCLSSILWGRGLPLSPSLQPHYQLPTAAAARDVASTMKIRTSQKYLFFESRDMARQARQPQSTFFFSIDMALHGMT